MLNEYRSYPDEPVCTTVDLLLSELKMWKAKETYERKLKASMMISITKKLKDDGFQMDS